jgi:hypothetical protein
MPIVIKASDNGHVDPKSKVIRLPEHMIPRPPKFDALRKAAATAIPLALLTFSSIPAQADVVSLNDGASASAAFNTSNGTGLNSLLIGGNQQVVSQWFDYRLGAAAGPAVTIDSANNGVAQTFNSVPGIGVNTASKFFNGTSNFFSVTYAGTYAAPVAVPFDMTVKYTLTSGGAKTASIAENITIDDNSATSQSLPISFYEYNHFNLNSQPHDNVSITGAPPNTATQISALSGASNIETVTTPAPSFYQAATGSTLTTEFASTFTNLTDLASAGPGDASWAFEWNPTLTLPGGGTFQISKVRTISVPEPGTFAGAVIGVASLLLRKRPRKQQLE